jgi:hypothetical protein
MWKRADITLIALLAWQLSTEFATACQCAPQPPLPPGTAPALRLPYLEGKDSAVFLGAAESVYPQASSDYEILWRKMYHEDLSEDRPPSIQKMRTFMLHFWRGAFSPAERDRIERAKSIDDLDSAVDSFWMAPRSVRFRVKERFAGPKTARLHLYTGFGDGIAASISKLARAGWWMPTAMTLADGSRIHVLSPSGRSRRVPS